MVSWCLGVLGLYMRCAKASLGLVLYSIVMRIWPVTVTSHKKNQATLPQNRRIGWVKRREYQRWAWAFIEAPLSVLGTLELDVPAGGADA